MSINDFPDGSRLTILLTGGRAPVTLDLARAFYLAGHRVLVAESARYHLCRVSRAVERSFCVPSPNADAPSFIEALESIIASERVDVLIPTCEELFFVAKGLERLRRFCQVWAAPIEQLGELHNKWTFVRLADRLGLTVPQTKLIQTPQEWLALAHEQPLSENLVLKPAYSRFASRVLFLEKGDSEAKRRKTLTEAVSAVSAQTPWVAQRHVYGRHLCTYSIACEGDLIAHAAYPCRYRVGQGATVYWQPIEHEAALRWVRKLVQAIRFTGQIAFDFIEEEDGALYALECNPRATSGIHLFGADGGGALVRAFLHPQSLRRSGAVLMPQQGHSAMLTAPMLAAGLADIRSLGKLPEWQRAFRSARDVVFSRSDMMPAVEQLRVLWDAWRTSRTRGIPLVHATTIDIEWNGDV